MNVTPLDLRQQQFRTAMRGFDKDEVTAFLAEAADDYAEAIREANGCARTCRGSRAS